MINWSSNAANLCFHNLQQQSMTADHVLVNTTLNVTRFALHTFLHFCVFMWPECKYLQSPGGVRGVWFFGEKAWGLGSLVEQLFSWQPLSLRDVPDLRGARGRETRTERWSQMKRWAESTTWKSHNPPEGNSFQHKIPLRWSKRRPSISGTKKPDTFHAA